jgi:hypothetical protein
MRLLAIAMTLGGAAVINGELNDVHLVVIAKLLKSFRTGTIPLINYLVVISYNEKVFGGVTQDCSQ